MSISSRRLPSEASRTAALDAARAILIEAGPRAVTLKAVAARIDRTHANLLHHFGSAEALQRALAEDMTRRITAQVETLIVRVRAREADPGEIIARLFDAFAREGGGALAAWLSLTGDAATLAPIFAEVRRLIDAVGLVGGEAERRAALRLILLACGDAIIGVPLTAALGLAPEAPREEAAADLLRLAAQASATAPPFR